MEDCGQVQKGRYIPFGLFAFSGATICSCSPENKNSARMNCGEQTPDSKGLVSGSKNVAAEIDKGWLSTDAVDRVHPDSVHRTTGVAGALFLKDFGTVFGESATELEISTKLAFEWVIPASSGKELDTNNTAVRFTVKGIQEHRLPTILDGTKCQDHEAWFPDNRAAAAPGVRPCRDVSTRTRRTGGRSNRSIRLCAPIFTVL